MHLFAIICRRKMPLVDKNYHGEDFTSIFYRRTVTEGVECGSATVHPLHVQLPVIFNAINLYPFAIHLSANNFFF